MNRILYAFLLIGVCLLSTSICFAENLPQIPPQQMQAIIARESEPLTLFSNQLHIGKPVTREEFRKIITGETVNGKFVETYTENFSNIDVYDLSTLFPNDPSKRFVPAKEVYAAFTKKGEIEYFCKMTYVIPLSLMIYPIKKEPVVGKYGLSRDSQTVTWIKDLYPGVNFDVWNRDSGRSRVQMMVSMKMGGVLLQYFNTEFEKYHQTVKRNGQENVRKANKNLSGW